jgi:hypothetical protein
VSCRWGLVPVPNYVGVVEHTASSGEDVGVGIVWHAGQSIEKRSVVPLVWQAAFVGTTVDVHAVASIGLCLGCRSARDARLAGAVLYLDAHMLKLEYRVEQCFVVGGWLGVVGDHGDDRGEMLWPHVPDVQIGDLVVGIGLDIPRRPKKVSRSRKRACSAWPACCSVIQAGSRKRSSWTRGMAVPAASSAILPSQPIVG